MNYFLLYKTNSSYYIIRVRILICCVSEDLIFIPYFKILAMHFSSGWPGYRVIFQFISNLFFCIIKMF